MDWCPCWCPLSDQPGNWCVDCRRQAGTDRWTDWWQVQGLFLLPPLGTTRTGSAYCQPLRHVGTAPPVATVQYITVLYCTVQSVAAGFQPSVGLGGRAPHVSETVSGCLLPGSSQQTLRTKYRHKVTTCSETERYPAECCGGEIPRQTSLCPPCQISGQGSAPSVPGEIQREKDFFQSHPAS